MRGRRSAKFTCPLAPAESSKGRARSTFTEGQRVRLRPFEENPEEFGTVIWVERADVVSVLVDKPYRDGRGDDGIREVTPEQLEVVGSAR